MNFSYITKEDIKDCKPNWPEIPDHIYRILIIGGSGSGKANALINHEPDIYVIYLYAKDPCKAKCKFLFNKRESTGLNYVNDSNDFVECSNDMDDIYKNIED